MPIIERQAREALDVLAAQMRAADQVRIRPVLEEIRQLGEPLQWMEAAPPQVAGPPDRWEVALDPNPFRGRFANPFKRQPIGKQGEELFQLILSGIREIYDVEATIAGGAVRDLAAGVVPSKDVDVFLPMDWKTFSLASEELGWQSPPALHPNAKAYKGGKGAPAGVGCFFPTTNRALAMVQNTPVDLVFMDGPLTKEHVETFPVHAQRGVWTLESGRILSPEAVKDVEAKTFTIDPKITDKARLKLVSEKVQGWLKRVGYEDWKIVEPETQEWWEAKAEHEAVVKAKNTQNKAYDPFWENAVKKAINNVRPE
jgi:hypothetical protein